MNIRLKSLLCISLFLSSFSSYGSNYYYESENQPTLKDAVVGAAIIGGIIGIGCGIYKLAQKIFTKSDEQIYQEAESHIHALHYKYALLINRITQERDSYNYDNDRYTYIDTIAEHISTQGNGSSFLGLLKADLSHLMHNYHNLNERLNNPRMKINTRKNIEQLTHDIRIFHQRLTEQYHILSPYEYYMNALLIIKDLRSIFYNELVYMQNYAGHPYNNHDLMKLRGFIMSSAERYPYLAYASKLSQSLNNLKTALEKLSGNDFIRLENTIISLHAYLTDLQTIILAQPEYHDELKERERNRLKEEQLALERRKIAAQEAQANAQRAQAWAQQDSANAQRAQARAQQNLANEQREHNRLKQLELINNRGF